VAHRRERQGFQPIGAPDLVGGLDLPARRARDLRLQAAWLGAAGEAIAARVRAVRIRRGVLELVADDPVWTRQIVDLLPRLAARLARAEPALGVVRFRLVTAGGPGPAQELAEEGREDEADLPQASPGHAPRRPGIGRERSGSQRSD
jgi:hypothetical protein